MERRSVNHTQRLDFSGEGLSTCKRIKDSGLHAEDYQAPSTERHSDRGRVIKVNPALIISSFRI